ncbi:MAG: hypothetical protein Ct9H300mP27_12780 [Chloroflexota bacterium]|nr:MAG: hypothetical protein Ct9H300mP27_12780 [Chloroflexota bacterium]
MEKLQITADNKANKIQPNHETKPDPKIAVQDNSDSWKCQPYSETYIPATREVDRERFRVANLGRLREVVFGAQDGILSTVALVTQ